MKNIAGDYLVKHGLYIGLSYLDRMKEFVLL